MSKHQPVEGPFVFTTSAPGEREWWLTYAEREDDAFRQALAERSPRKEENVRAILDRHMAAALDEIAGGADLEETAAKTSRAAIREIVAEKAPVDA